ncbi:mannose-binding protein-like [Drosophila suzukii]|uniref:Mannose-binding protein-like n=1 Tax=Drosophila suzukii TaxID=28584 RepID=A0ABM4U0C5_DROSZ
MLAAIFFYVLVTGSHCGSLAVSQNIPGPGSESVDFGTRCNGHCFSRMKTVMDFVAVNQDRWNTCQEITTNVTRADQNQIQIQLTSLQDAVTNVRASQEFQNGKLDRMDSQQIAMQESLRNIIPQNFVDMLSRSEAHLIAIESKLQTMQTILDNKLRALEGKLSSFIRKVIPPVFQLIGKRYFYIEERNEKTWVAANSTCREMGGYLASIKNEEEWSLLSGKLKDRTFYWLGIHEQLTRSNFVSVASDKEVPFFNWKPGEPLYVDDSMHCVLINSGLMHVDPCNKESFLFICQADDEVKIL